MSITPSNRSRRWRVGALVAATVMVGAGVTYAAIPSTTTGRVTACYATSGVRAGLLRLIDQQAGQKCLAGERSINWQANGMRYAGVYSAAITYAKDDVVTYQGSSWVSTTTNKGVTPAPSTRWKLLVAKGATGNTGATGPQGPKGDPGTTGAQYGRTIIQLNTVAVGASADSLAMAMKVDGTPVFVYTDFNAPHDLSTISCFDITCGTSISTLHVDAAATTTRPINPSITIGPDGNPRISYTDDLTGELYVIACADPDCATPASHTNTGNVAAIGSTSQITIAPDGSSGIVFVDTTGKVSFTTCVEADCLGVNDAVPVVVDALAGGARPSLTYNTLGLPVIAYQVTNPSPSTAHELRLAFCQDSGCSAADTVTLDSFATAEYTPQALIGMDGSAVVVATDTNRDIVRFASCAGATCAVNTTTIASGNPIGPDASLGFAIAPNGNPVIAHPENGSLSLLSCADAACTTSTQTFVETGATFGINPTIGIGNTGNPSISYLDSSNGDIRLATVGHSSWYRNGWGR